MCISKRNHSSMFAPQSYHTEKVSHSSPLPPPSHHIINGLAMSWRHVRYRVLCTIHNYLKCGSYMLIVYIITEGYLSVYYVTVYMKIRVGSSYMLASELEWNGILYMGRYYSVLCYTSVYYGLALYWEYRGDADILTNCAYVLLFNLFQVAFRKYSLQLRYCMIMPWNDSHFRPLWNTNLCRQKKSTLSLLLDSIVSYTFSA